MIRFILNNTVIETEAKSGMTLLDFIREHQQLKGTKIGCREGDCGACTVLTGTLTGDTIKYQSITSCISPLVNANGKHIVTIEGINLTENLTVVQDAMAENYATQCGFCTPGFVVSYTGHALNFTENSCKDDAVSGNICRCTGYKSIEKAGDEIVKNLQELQNTSVENLIKNRYLPEYFKTIPDKLKKLQTANTEFEFNQNQIVANGTDLYVRYADLLSEKNIQSIAELPLLKGINCNANECIIGASTTVTELWENNDFNKIIPDLKSFLKLVSSQQIRNMGTLGGNFVNASPIGDMSIFFLALNSSLTILNTNNQNTRTIPFQKFHQDYKKYDLQKGELIQSISFKKIEKNELFNFEKVSKRTHLDIASVNSAGRILTNNNRIEEAHFSVGGVSAIPKYLDKTNTFLNGKKLNMDTIKKAEEILQQEIAPISDVRGSNIYKRLLARQLFFAHFIKWFPNQFTIKDLI